MSHHWCCCDTPCLIASDDFQRSDNDNPGERWIEVAPGNADTTNYSDWDISSGVLVYMSGGPLVTTWRQSRPPRYKEGDFKYCYSTINYVTLKNMGLQEDHKINSCGVICGFRNPDDYHWISFDYVSGIGVFPSFINRHDGINDIILSKTSHSGGHPFVIDSDGDVKVRICYSNVDWTVDQYDGVIGGVQNPIMEYNWTMCGGGQCPLPTGFLNKGEMVYPGMAGFTSGVFDDWHYYTHWESNVDCPYCSCFCLDPSDNDEYACFPETLTATFIPTQSTYRCEKMDYVSHTLRQGYVGTGSTFIKSPQKRQWVADYENTFLYSYPVVFRCSSSMSGHLVYFNVTDTGEGAPYHYSHLLDIDWSESTCSPLNLVFKTVHNSTTTCSSGDMYGIRSVYCPTGDCIASNIPNQNYLANQVKWNVVITE
jgi:hypothetical protein